MNPLLVTRLSNPNLTQWMSDHNITSSTGLHTYYADRILNTMRQMNATPIVWQDVWDEKVVVRLLRKISRILYLYLILAATRDDHPGVERHQWQQWIRFMGLLPQSSSQPGLQCHSVQSLVLELYQLRKVQYEYLCDESGVFQILRSGAPAWIHR